MTLLAAFPPLAADLAALGDEQLMQLQREVAARRRRADAEFAAVAGEVARRSAREFGLAGLAQRVGARTAERLVSNLTGVSAGEARAMISAGTADADEWMATVTSAVGSGEISVGAAAAIRSGLGTPTDVVDADALSRAADRLADEAQSLPPEKVAERARRARDELDAEHVADRERALRQRRSLRLFPQHDGMTRLVGVLDPESAALVTDAIDRVTAPRRGGVRFVDPAERERAARIESDPRTTEQLALDALVQMVRLAAAVDDGTVFGVKSPAVRVHVSLAELARGVGAAGVEGQTAAVGVDTARRLVCTTGLVPILFDGTGRALDVGRTQRLHTARQRLAIAARDGGCLIGGCDRPPSWCEVHHPVPWHEGGETSVDNGVLLCRHHHMWLHDTGRRIAREGSRYVLHDPGGGAPEMLISKGAVGCARG